MTTDLQALLSQPPASFAWSSSEDGHRTIGTTVGCGVDIWSDRIEVAALFPPDNAELAARNATLFQLILAALRPDWVTAGEWLASQMTMAARSKEPYEGVQYSRQVRFGFSRRSSTATLKVKRL